MPRPKQPRRWVEFRHEPHPTATPTIRRWGHRPLGMTNFVEGRVRAEAISRAASSLSGEPSVDTATLTLDDEDGEIRELLSLSDMQWFRNREVTYKLLSSEGVAAALNPRVRFGGRCTDLQLGDERTATMQAEDILAPYLDRKYPQYTLNDSYPFRFTDPNQDADNGDPNWDPGLQIPFELREKVMSIFYGPHINTAVDPVTGVVAEGLVPAQFMGYTGLVAGTGDVGDPTPQQMALMQPFYQPSFDWGGWGELFIGLGEYDITNVYTSDLNTTAPPRSILNTEDIGITVLAPNHPGWPFSTPYVYRNGFLCTVIYVRGPLLWHHITNVVRVTVDLCGWKSAVNGLMIDQAGFAWQDFMTQHVLAHDGAGFKNGPSISTVPQFDDGRYQFWTSKIQEWQELTAQRLGDSTGYIISMALTEPTTLRQIRQEFNLTFDCHDAKTSEGALYLFSINDLADPADGVPIREHIELKKLSAPKLDWPSMENWIDYTVGWNVVHEEPRTPVITAKNQDSIDALKGEVKKQNTPRHLKFTAHDTTSRDVIGRRLRRLSIGPPRMQPLDVGTEGIDRYIGELVAVSHQDGIGAKGIGYSGTSMQILRQDSIEDEMNLVAIDTSQIIAASMNGPLASGGQGWNWITWTVE
jgi:hypothetical protein